MVAPISLIAGLVLACGLVFLARRNAHARQLRVYAVGLVAAALIYVGFAASRGAATRDFALEFFGAVAFGTVAWLSLRAGNRALLAAGWAAHVLWDLPLHLHEPGARYVPEWYVWLCVSFDLVIAAALIVPPQTRTVRPGSSVARDRTED